MRFLFSLRSRIFLASAALAVLSIGVAIYLVNLRVSQEAERTLEREIVSTAALVDNLRTTRTDTFLQMARFMADAPPLKAAVDTDDPATVQDVANGYQQELKSNLLLVTNRTGRVLATVGASTRTAALISDQPAVRNALAGRDGLSLLPQPGGMIQLATVPVFIGLSRPDILGSVSVGFMLDDALAAQLKQITLSDIAFGVDGQILAATLPRSTYAALGDRLQTTGRSRVQLGAVEYEVLPLRLAAADDPGRSGTGPVALILRSRTEQLRSLETIRQGLEATAVVAVLLATVLSFAVARTIARPLAAITDVMRSVAVTGDLTRKIAVGRRSRWEDEDAQLLATTFNTLTDSIARFQRQMSQKERLASLGRLSTVIAHEIRNPLMIIKATLHALRQPDLTPGGLREAVSDIDEEVARLNRIVNDVLDFARPIRFELAAVDLNALCRDSVGAVRAAVPGAPISLALDPAPSTTTTDPERLRIALVNLLLNACHAVNGRGPAPGGEPAAPPPLVTLSARVEGDRVRLAVTDSGAGISPADLGQIFDPYFTTKRGGTGLGLPIVKNIVEGLGGTITAASTPGRGTEIQIDLPLNAPVPDSSSVSSPVAI